MSNHKTKYLAYAFLIYFIGEIGFICLCYLRDLPAITLEVEHSGLRQVIAGLIYAIFVGISAYPLLLAYQFPLFTPFFAIYFIIAYYYLYKKWKRKKFSTANYTIARTLQESTSHPQNHNIS